MKVSCGVLCLLLLVGWCWAQNAWDTLPTQPISPRSPGRYVPVSCSTRLSSRSQPSFLSDRLDWHMPPFVWKHFWIYNVLIRRMPGVSSNNCWRNIPLKFILFFMNIPWLTNTSQYTPNPPHDLRSNLVHGVNPSSSYWASQSSNVVNSVLPHQYFNYIDIVYQNQADFQNSVTFDMTGEQVCTIFQGYTAQVGLSASQFTEGMNNSTLTWDVTRNWKWAASKGVYATPSYLCMYLRCGHLIPEHDD